MSQKTPQSESGLNVPPKAPFFHHDPPSANPSTSPICIQSQIASDDSPSSLMTEPVQPSEYFPPEKPASAQSYFSSCYQDVPMNASPLTHEVSFQHIASLSVSQSIDSSHQQPIQANERDSAAKRNAYIRELLEKARNSKHVMRCIATLEKVICLSSAVFLIYTQICGYTAVKKRLNAMLSCMPVVCLLLVPVLFVLAFILDTELLIPILFVVIIPAIIFTSILSRFIHIVNRINSKKLAMILLLLKSHIKRKPTMTNRHYHRHQVDETLVTEVAIAVIEDGIGQEPLIHHSYDESGSSHSHGDSSGAGSLDDLGDIGKCFDGDAADFQGDYGAEAEGSYGGGGDFGGGDFGGSDFGGGD